MRRFRSVRQARRDFWVLMPQSPIYSILEGILFALNIIGISGSVRSKNGVRRLLEIAGLVSLGLKKLTCQYFSTFAGRPEGKGLTSI